MHPHRHLHRPRRADLPSQPGQRPPALRPALAQRPVAWAAAMALAWAGGLLPPPAAWALPQGAVPSSGQVQVGTPVAGTLDIVQTSAQAGIDWRSFSIAAGERLRVLQPDARAVLFNRVVGADPSLILGRLQANGRVFLSNPRGIVFGAGSQVDVGGLLATTLTLETQALANGRWQLSGGRSDSAVLRADGSIHAPQGTVALASPTLEVSGQIQAARIGLAAAGAVQVDVDGDGLIFFNLRDEGLANRLRLLPAAELRAASAELRAAARSGMADTVLNLEGVVRASGLARRGGQVVIDGGAQGLTQVAGTLDVSSLQPGGLGGEISLRAERLLLVAGARLDARGDAGGGRISVGGAWQGQDEGRLPGRHAQATQVLAGALIDASALRLGDGGRVVLWADGSTQFDGRIQARGGVLGGQGGQVETSGRLSLGITTGRVDAGAGPLGQAGLWLLDPNDIVVQTAGATVTLPADLGQVADVTLGGATQTVAPAALDAAGTSVALQASNSIRFAEAVLLRTEGAGLSARAGGNISVLAPITTANGAISLSANDTFQIPASGGNPARTINPSGSGAVLIGAGANLDAGSAAILLSNNGSSAAHAIAADLSAGSLTLTGPAVLEGARSFNLSSSSQASSLAGNLSDSAGGSASLSKSGAGTLSLSGSNSYSGGTTLAGGTLLLAGASALPAAGALSVSAGTLDLGGAERPAGLVTLLGGAIVNGTLQGSGYVLQAGTVSALLADPLLPLPAVASLVKRSDGSASGGSVLLSAANTYSGGTRLEAGSLVLDGAGRAGSAAVSLGSGSTLDLRNGAAQLGLLQLDGGTLANSAGAASINGDLRLRAATTLQIDSDAAGLAISGALGADGAGLALRKAGSGVLTMLNGNSYDGGTTVAEGSLVLAGASARAGSGLVRVESGARLDLRDGARLASPQTLVLNGGTLANSQGSATLDGAITLAASSTLEAATPNLALNGLIDDNGAGHALAKTGGGTLTLGLAHRWGGGTTVAAGTLALLAGGQAGSGTIRVDSGATLALGDGVSLANAVRLQGGLLQAGSGSATLAGPLTLAAHSTLQVDGQGLTLAGTVADEGAGFSLAKTGGGSLALSGPNTWRGGLRLLAGTLLVSADHQLGAAGAGLSLAGGTLSAEADVVLDAARSLTLQAPSSTVNDNGHQLSVLGAIVGEGVLVKAGNGTLTLGGSNSWRGGLRAGAGTLVLNSASALGADSGGLALDGSILRLGADITLGAGRSLTLGAAGATIETRGQTLLVLGNFSGNGSLVKRDAGTLSLRGSSTYDGDIVLQGGTLTLDGPGLAGSGLIVLQAGATLDLRNDARLAQALLMAGGTLANSVGSAALDGAITLLAPGRFDVAGSLRLGGVISDGVPNAGLLKTGPGTLILAAANRHAGATTVAGGTLALADGSALGAPGNALVLDGATLRADADLLLGAERPITLGAAGAAINSNGHAVVVNARIDGPGALAKAGAGDLALAGNNAFGGEVLVSAGTLTLRGGQALPDNQRLSLADASGSGLRLQDHETIGALAGGGSRGGNLALGGFNLSTGGLGLDTLYAGTIDGSGGLIKLGGGSFTLAGSNRHSGPTTLQAGTLRLQNAQALANSTLTLADSPGVTLALAADAGIGALAGGGGLGGRVLLGGFVLAVGTNQASSQFSGQILGSGGLVKQGAGRFTLAGSNRFSGTATVLGGSLALQGGAALGDAVAVSLADAGGVALLLNGDQTIGSLAGGGAAGGALQLGGFTLSTGGNGDSTHFGGAISGSGALLKQGDGRLALSGNNRHAGGTTVAGGALAVAADAALGSGPLRLAGGRLQATASFALAPQRAITLQGRAGFEVDAGQLLQLAGTLADGSSAGSLVKTGAGTLQLASAAGNRYSGATEVRGGMLSISADNQLGSVPGGATPQPLLLDGGTLQARQSLRLAARRSIALGPAGGSLDVADGATLQVGALISSQGGVPGTLAGGLSKRGAGRLVLDGAADNTHAGATWVLGGELQIQRDGQLGSAPAQATPGQLLLDGAALHWVADGGSAGGSGAGLPGEATLDARRGLALGAAGGTLRVDDALNLRYAGLIADANPAPGSPAGMLSKAGAGQLSLAALQPSSYRGATAVSGGTLAITQDSQLGSAPASASAGHLQLDGGRLLALASLRLAASRGIGLGAAGGTLVVAAGQTLDYAGVVADGPGVGADGGAGLTQAGAGTLHFDGADDNRYRGPTTLLAGSLLLQRDGQLGAPPLQATPGHLRLDGGTLRFGADATLAAQRGISLGPAGGTLAVDGGAQLAYGGVIADAAPAPGTAAGALRKAGAGLLMLSGAGAWQGDTWLLAGSLVTSGNQRLPAASRLRLANGTAWRLGGAQSLALLADADPAGADGSAQVDLQQHPLTLDIAAAETGALFQGRLAIADGGRLVKQGEGLLRLGGIGQGAGLLQVLQGTLASVAPQALPALAQAQVAAPATLQVDAALTLASLRLDGRLAGGATLSVTGSAALQGGTLAAALLAGTLSSAGPSHIAAPVQVAGRSTVADGTLNLDAGGSLQSAALHLQPGSTLATSAAQQLGQGAALQQAAGSLLQLAGSEAVASYTSAGRLQGPAPAGGPGGAPGPAGPGAVATLQVAGDALLSDAQIQMALQADSLQSHGNTTLDAPVLLRGQALLADGQLALGAAGSLHAPLLHLQAGRLSTASASADPAQPPQPPFASDSALVVDAGATLQLGADAAVRTLQLAGTLAGAPGVQLSARESAQLDGGQLLAALATATFSSQGSSHLGAAVQAGSRSTLAAGSLLISTGGHLATPLLQLQAGASLITQADGPLDAQTTLLMAPGSRWQLGGSQVLGRLADGADGVADAAGGARPAQVQLGEQTLSVGGNGQFARFSGQLSGGGSLVKQGDGTLLLAADQGHGATRIEAGLLQLGEGGGQGSLGSGPVLNDGVLRFERSDELLLAQQISGSGRLQQAGSGTLLLTHAGNRWSGATEVLAGTLRTAAAERLPDASALQLAAGASLVLGGDETLLSIAADGPVQLGGSVFTRGDQRYGGPVTLASAAPVTLAAPGARIEALHDGNQWGGLPLSVTAGGLRLSAGKLPAQAGAAAAYRDLVLGAVTLSGLPASAAAVSASSVALAGPAAARPLAEADATASRIDAGQLQIGQGAADPAAAGDSRLDGLLQLQGGSLSLLAHALPSYQPLEAGPAGRAAVDPLAGRELRVAGDVLLQGPRSQLLSEAGASLLLQAVAGGSIRLDQVRNRLAGGVSALSGSAFDSAWAAPEVAGGRAVGQSRITLAGQVLQVGGRGLEADLLRLSAGQLGADAGSLIAARLWYNDAAFGQLNSSPGLQLQLLPEAFAGAGNFGNAARPLPVSVGSRALGAALGGTREGLSAGYVQVLPRRGASGATAVFLAGPRVGDAGYRFFHDGAAEQAELPVFYNGVLPATPQLSGSLSAVASVSESARRERFDEAVRTENVAIRLRAGVIAEVGPGRPAAQGSEGLQPPPRCSGSGGQLDCAR